MGEACEECRYAAVYEVQMGTLREDLAELKARMDRLEALLSRGVLLLVANLTGVVIALAHQIV
jgi:hypothetical protein